MCSSVEQARSEQHEALAGGCPPTPLSFLELVLFARLMQPCRHIASYFGDSAVRFQAPLHGRHRQAEAPAKPSMPLSPSITALKASNSSAGALFQPLFPETPIACESCFGIGMLIAPATAHPKRVTRASSRNDSTAVANRGQRSRGLC